MIHSRLLPWLALAFWLVALALLQPVNHDEDQYVGAAALAGAGLRAYRDFLVLQPPLQIWLTGPIVAATPGWSFVALRLTNAALALVALAFVHAAQRRMGVSRRVALWTCALLATAIPFAYGARVARNDMLPTALVALALWQVAGWRDHRRPAMGLAIAGLALGLAASTKLSFGLPLLAAGLLLAWRAVSTRDPGRWSAVMAFAASGLAGLLPIAAAWLGDPDAFAYGVFTFATNDTPAWYRMTGQAERLTLASKLRDSLFILVQGPALLALVLLMVRRPWRFGMVEAILVGALVGALLPTPTWTQYFIAMLPPLFVALGRDRDRLPRLAVPALTACAVVVAGVLAIIGAIDWRAAGAPPALAVVRDARWIGAHTLSPGMIISLSTSRVLDSGIPIDPRFATGVFVFRSSQAQSPSELSRRHAVGPHTLVAELDRLPPAAILTGYEGRSGINGTLRPDAPLVAWAQANRYAPVSTPDGRGTLWRKPPS